ncbi:MAG: AMP-binding protein [Thermodesulfobacteriota bacterium]
MEKQNSLYWNPVLETLPREKLVEIELKNFRRYLRYAKEHSAFYRKKLKDIEPEDIRTLQDLKGLPLTEKEDLRIAQASEEPTIYGHILGVDPRDVTTFRQTSGTTGKPVYVPESSESWYWRVEVWCHLLWMAGFRETDRVFVPFGYNVYVAFWEGHYAAEKLGCEVVPGGALDTKARISKMLEVKPSGLLNTPAYGLHMAEVANEMGVNPRDIGIKRMLCSGEPMPPATRKMLEAVWNTEVYDHIGGTEPCAWAAMCTNRSGLHVMEPFSLVEILDLETQTKEVAEGELGIAVVTPLGRRSFPLVRFNTKDVVRRGADGCPCGRNSTIISEVAGRSDHLRKIRGVLFTPVSVEDLVRQEFPEITEFEIVVEKKGAMDEITLRVELSDKPGGVAPAEFSARLSERLKIKTNLRFQIVFASRGELPRYTLKSKRFKDLREM